MSDRFTFRALGPAARPGGRPDFSEISERLIIGEYPTPEDAGWLRSSLQVTAVVCLQDDSDLAGKFLRLADLRRAYEAEGLEFHRKPIIDGDAVSLAAALDEVVALVHRLIDGGERVYVHCNAGMNRAPTIAIAYLHVHSNMPLADARRWVKERRVVSVPYMSVLEARYG
jgi:protein-tyrosine phosphatase